MAERNSDHQFALASIFIYVGRAYMETKDFDKSRLYFEKSMAIIDAEKEKGMDEKFYLHKMNYPLHALGVMYYNACEYKDAEQTFRKAIEVRRRLSEIDSAYDDEYANSLSALSVILCDQLKYDEAMAAIDEAATVCERVAKYYTDNNDKGVFDVEHELVEVLYGNVLYGKKDYESSMAHFQTAKDIMEKSCGKVMKLRKDLPNCYACIGKTYLAMQDMEKAEDAYLTAYAKAKELYDEDHDGHHELFEAVCAEVSKFYRKIGKKRTAKKYEGKGER